MAIDLTIVNSQPMLAGVLSIHWLAIMSTTIHKEFKMNIYGKQVVTRNGVTDVNKLDDLIADMVVHGWRGRPIIVADMGGYVQAFTGSHRLTAASVTGAIPELVWLPTMLSEDGCAGIYFANDDDDLLRVFQGLEADHPEMVSVVEVMRQEVESNNEGR